jgi:sterol desaturase/sphingolipid hydroxylase (fatty acid hydroxylase superfamily)
MSISPSPALVAIVSALLMSGIVALRYIATSGLFDWLTRRRMAALYIGKWPQIRREIGWSLLNCLIYGVPAGIVAWGWQARGWTQIYRDVHAWPLWVLPLSVLAFLILHDMWFYWTHRWMHAPRLFRAMHAVHHESRPPTAWAAMSFHPWEGLTGALVIPALVFVIPIHVGALAVVLTIMTVMGVTNHMGWEMFPRWMVQSRLGAWLITASHHQRHHERYLCNYGLYFRWWDRWCGTDKGLADW